MGQGRPHKLTPPIYDLIVGMIRKGNYQSTAAGAAGIDRTTLNRWRKWGKDLEEEYAPEPPPNTHPHKIFYDFGVAITRAQEESEADFVAAWKDHVPDDWRAARDLLARRFPGRWKEQTHTQLTGPEGGPLEITDARDAIQSKLDRLATENTEDETPPEPVG